MLVIVMEVMIYDPFFVTVCWARHNDGLEIIQKDKYQAHLQSSMDERLSGTSKYMDESIQDK